MKRVLPSSMSIVVLTGVFLFFTHNAVPVFAQTTPEQQGPTTPGQNCPPGAQSGTVCLQNPLGDLSDPRIIVGQVIRVSLGIIGSLALILFIYGGMLWMTSSGNTEMVTKGRNTLLWAVIGLIVVFGSYAIVNFILQNLPKG